MLGWHLIAAQSAALPIITSCHPIHYPPPHANSQHPSLLLAYLPVSLCLVLLLAVCINVVPPVHPEGALIPGMCPELIPLIRRQLAMAGVDSQFITTDMDCVSQTTELYQVGAAESYSVCTTCCLLSLVADRPPVICLCYFGFSAKHAHAGDLDSPPATAHVPCPVEDCTTKNNM